MDETCLKNNSNEARTQGHVHSQTDLLLGGPDAAGDLRWCVVRSVPLLPPPPLLSKLLRLLRRLELRFSTLRILW